MEWKIFTFCPVCKKWRVYISKRVISIPTGGTAISQKLMCGDCYKNIKIMIKLNNNGK